MSWKRSSRISSPSSKLTASRKSRLPGCLHGDRGLFHSIENPALNAAECGLAMVNAAINHSVGWHVRVGGISVRWWAGDGEAQLRLRRVGDTVNVAARVAAEAEPDAVIVTGATWPVLSRTCQGRALGLFDLGARADGTCALSRRK